LDYFFYRGDTVRLFPSKMKNMLLRLNEINNSQLRSGGLIFAVIGFIIIWYIKS